MDIIETNSEWSYIPLGNRGCPMYKNSPITPDTKTSRDEYYFKNGYWEAKPKQEIANSITCWICNKQFIHNKRGPKPDACPNCKDTFGKNQYEKFRKLHKQTQITLENDEDLEVDSESSFSNFSAGAKEYSRESAGDYFIGQYEEIDGDPINMDYKAPNVYVQRRNQHGKPKRSHRDSYDTFMNATNRFNPKIIMDAMNVVYRFFYPPFQKDPKFKNPKKKDGYENVWTMDPAFKDPDYEDIEKWYSGKHWIPWVDPEFLIKDSKNVEIESIDSTKNHVKKLSWKEFDKEWKNEIKTIVEPQNTAKTGPHKTKNIRLKYNQSIHSEFKYNYHDCTRCDFSEDFCKKCYLKEFGFHESCQQTRDRAEFPTEEELKRFNTVLNTKQHVNIFQLDEIDKINKKYTVKKTEDGNSIWDPYFTSEKRLTKNWYIKNTFDGLPGTVTSKINGKKIKYRKEDAIRSSCPICDGKYISELTKQPNFDKWGNAYCWKYIGKILFCQDCGHMMEDNLNYHYYHTEN